MYARTYTHTYSESRPDETGAICERTRTHISIITAANRVRRKPISRYVCIPAINTWHPLVVDRLPKRGPYGPGTSGPEVSPRRANDAPYVRQVAPHTRRTVQLFSNFLYKLILRPCTVRLSVLISRTCAPSHLRVSDHLSIHEILSHV